MAEYIEGDDFKAGGIQSLPHPGCRHFLVMMFPGQVVCSLHYPPTDPGDIVFERITFSLGYQVSQYQSAAVVKNSPELFESIDGINAKATQCRVADDEIDTIIRQGDIPNVRLQELDPVDKPRLF